MIFPYIFMTTLALLFFLVLLSAWLRLLRRRRRAKLAAIWRACQRDPNWQAVETYILGRPPGVALLELLEYLEDAEEYGWAGELLDRFPPGPDANRQVAVVAARLESQLGRHQRAQPLLNGLLQRQPRDASLLELSLLNAFELGDQQLAASLFPRYLALRPKGTRALLFQALILAGGGRGEEALPLLHKALERERTLLNNSHDPQWKHLLERQIATTTRWLERVQSGMGGESGKGS
jgi:tetratricopeptide (TPR) repeat protein